MPQVREVKQLMRGRPTIEGAGVRLSRIFGFGDTSLTDPFLLLDHFKSDRPEDFLPGFPWHPHRGIETITYVVTGDVEHGDSLGNQGTIGPGDVQWMTAGSGIIHQEMPKGDDRGKMDGFQLWANLPSTHKMMSPRYRDVAAKTIPIVEYGSGIQIKVIAGRVGKIEGPVRDVVIEPEYLEVRLPPKQTLDHPTKQGHTVLAYVYEGQVHFGQAAMEPVAEGTLAVFDPGDLFTARAGDQVARFILVSGKPLREPVAWRGPIVMNTEEELRQAFQEYRDGTFIKE